MYKRMKLANKQFIRSNASELFSHLNFTVRKLFDETVNNIEAHNRLEFMRFCKEMRKSLLGVDTAPDTSAQQEAERLVQGFTQEHEDPTCALLDDLKTRLQRIPLPLAR